jgi:hypothetical protein
MVNGKLMMVFILYNYNNGKWQALPLKKGKLKFNLKGQKFFIRILRSDHLQQFG